MIQKITLFVFFLLVFNLPLYSQALVTEKKLDSLTTVAMVAKKETNYAKALKLFSDAELLAKKDKLYNYLWFIKNNTGNIYRELSDYGEALNNFNKALSIIESHPELKSRTLFTLNNIAALYSESGDTKKALEFYKRAYAMAQEYDKTYASVVIAGNIASIYNKTNRLEEAYVIIMGVKKKFKDSNIKKKTMQLWQLSYAEILFLRGEVTRSRKMLEELFPETIEERVCYTCILELLGRIYAAEGKLDLAIAYNQKGLENNHELGDRMDLFAQLSELYAKKGNYIMALKYKDSVVYTKDSLSRKINRQLFAVNKVKLGIQEYQNELKINSENRKRDRIIFIVIGVLALVVFYAVYKSQRNRTIKQRQKRLLLENEKIIANLEMERKENEHLLIQRKMDSLKSKSKLKQTELENKISQKNRELSANALYHSNRNELLQKIIASLEEIPGVLQNTAIRDYVQNLKGFLRTDTKWEDFISHFEKVNPGFLKALDENFPNLTKKDLRFLCYLYMNLGTKEICNILNISPEAVWKRKQRIAKKMDMKADGLYNFLLRLGESDSESA